MMSVKIRMILPIRTLHLASVIVTQSTKVSFLKCFLTLKKKLKSQAKHRKAKKKAKKSTIADSYLDPDTDDIGAPQGSFVTPAQKSQGQSRDI